MLPKKGRKGSMPQNLTNGNNCNGENVSTNYVNLHLKDIGEEWLSYPKQVISAFTYITCFICFYLFCKIN